ncbi:DUF2778 domain-containing protein [Vibrio cincinnatiensis]|uniref:DUF2778 domain-containing protein n=1 Tax=Vibrio cincinnatiensis TaxID=675 RepID=UPI001EDCD746|nr:DUF2778 domain-containing protein [Vibrio cincinnatiensis]MCG3727633.1 DUF2778 domain-containing protein [Vibrio cincinnatiensis]
MLEFTFELNGQHQSKLKCGAASYTAFSGEGAHRNKKASQCLVGSGPIPTGTYYIFDRQSGGLLGSLRDFFSGKDKWFALYAADSKMDDETICINIKRGQFRLHPKGPLGVSKGCIVVEHHRDFATISARLKNTATTKIPGLGLETYGRVIVK